MSYNLMMKSNFTVADYRSFQDSDIRGRMILDQSVIF
jgi:hypothetical protein